MAGWQEVHHRSYPMRELIGLARLPSWRRVEGESKSESESERKRRRCGDGRSASDM